MLGTRPAVASIELRVNGIIADSAAVLSDAGDDGIDTATLNWTVPCERDGAYRWRLAAGTTVEARGIGADGATVATHVLVAPASTPSRLELVVDVPSPSTGTGSHLVLDGRDTAMLRATLLDDHGALVSGSPARVAFTVVRGHGRVLGSGNGNPTNHEPLISNAVSTFGGLARGLVQASVDCSSANHELLRLVDVDGDLTTPLLRADDASATEHIRVRATAEIAPGASVAATTLTAEVSIAVSCDAATDGALGVARRQVADGGLNFTYLASFLG